MVKTQSAITCPECGFRATEAMPADACLYSYVCKNCGLEMKPEKGGCCIFCAYGDVPCPPVQEALNACCSGSRSSFPADF